MYPEFIGAFAVFLCIGSSPCLARRNSRRYGSTASATESASMPWRRPQSGNMFSAILDSGAWPGDVGGPAPHAEVGVRRGPFLFGCTRARGEPRIEISGVDR